MRVVGGVVPKLLIETCSPNLFSCRIHPATTKAEYTTTAIRILLPYDHIFNTFVGRSWTRDVPLTKLVENSSLGERFSFIF